uniref:Uncharacterized protein n=1 Tax=Steinernema glaseri TaxID=37863 RepID=A0A1I7Z1V9_9BILA
MANLQEKCPAPTQWTVSGQIVDGSTHSAATYVDLPSEPTLFEILRVVGTVLKRTEDSTAVRLFFTDTTSQAMLKAFAKDDDSLADRRNPCLNDAFKSDDDEDDDQQQEETEPALLPSLPFAACELSPIPS